MVRKKRHPKQRGGSPCFVFTQETLLLVQKALRLFEQSLAQLKGPPAQVAFAAETMQHLHEKVESMLASADQIALTAFDYNEKIVLVTAMRLYILEILALPLNAKRQQELRQCQRIERFALDHLTDGPSRTLHD